MPELRPAAVVAADAAGVDAEVARLRAEKWSVQQGFVLPEEPWDLGGDRRVCAGPVGDDAQASAALLAAVRGADLVVTLELPVDAAAAFRADLQRVADVRELGATTTAPGLPLDDAQLQLLRLLGNGRTMAEAAAELFLSLRTAERKLGAARRALGVATTAEAVARVRQQLSSDQK
jgi:DNA-binding CsgD family transcriptional regulator